MKFRVYKNNSGFYKIHYKPGLFCLWRIVNCIYDSSAPFVRWHYAWASKLFGNDSALCFDSMQEAEKGIATIKKIFEMQKKSKIWLRVK